MTIPTPPVTNANLNTTFSIALQYISTGLNFRNVKGNQTIGLVVYNNYDVSTITLAASGSTTLYAYQFIGISSDTQINVTQTPDQTATISSPGSSTSAGYVFALSGSFLTGGVTLYNPTSNTATITVATVS